MLAFFPACGDDGSGGGQGPNSNVDPNGDAGAGAAAGPRSFRHPGLLHTEEDFARMRAKIGAGAQPWVDGYGALTRSGRAQLGSVPHPLQTVIRGGDGENFRTMVEDLERAYQFALRWKISDDRAYADLAVQFLDAWSSTMTTLTGNADRFIAAGLYGYQWANAAEIMRTYPGWPTASVARFQKLLLDVFYPLCHDFLLKHNGAVITNYWASWDLLTLCGILAIGAFCDREDIYGEAIDYFQNGQGNGAIAHAIYSIHPGYLGQWQESGRDQGHSTLSISCLASLCEMAWNQGDDLYGYDNNRFLAGAQYVAKSNLKDANGKAYELPFSTYINNQGTMTAVSTAGMPNLRPCWESIYNHYVNRKGLAAPWVSAIAAQIRPEGATWNGDDPSFGTLTHSLDPIAEGGAPSGLTGRVVGGKVLLSWWGSAHATGYQVKRSASADGPFESIGRVDEPCTYMDAPGHGVWHYRVAAIGAGGESNPSNGARMALPTESRLLLQDGALTGGASWGDGGVLVLDGTSGHLELPQGALSELGDVTVALWVYWNKEKANTRVFDFGSSDIAYMALVPRDASGILRFAITGTTYFGEQSIRAKSALPTAAWVHLAITLSGTVGTLYVNGVVAGTNDAISLAPFQLGKTTRNWLGRSQYATDPYFDGRMRDLRIMSGALGPSEIAALAQ